VTYVGLSLLGPDVELRRTEYDLNQAVAELRSAGFSELDEMIAESLLEPADPEWVSEFFERQAVRQWLSSSSRSPSSDLDE
jgi:hypothetical protein